MAPTREGSQLRRWYRDQVCQIFLTVDLILAPTMPCPAPLIEQITMDLEGETVLVRPHLGFYTQPLSFIGLPMLSVPVHLPGELSVAPAPMMNNLSLLLQSLWNRQATVLHK